MEYNNRINRPESQSEEKKTTDWRLPVVLSAMVLVVVLLATNIYLGLVNRQRKPLQGNLNPTLSPTVILLSGTPAQTTGNPNRQQTSSMVDLPPLYPGLKWKYTEKKVQDGSYTLKGDTIELEMYRADSEMLTSYPSDFINYYKHELEMDRWTQTANTQGGINGHDYFAYEKGGNYINFGVFTARNPGSSKIIGYYAFVEHN